MAELMKDFVDRRQRSKLFIGNLQAHSSTSPPGQSFPASRYRWRPIKRHFHPSGTPALRNTASDVLSPSRWLFFGGNLVKTAAKDFDAQPIRIAHLLKGPQESGQD